MWRLDFERLAQDDVDPLLRDLLITVHYEDTVRRVRSAFPEFFSEDMQLGDRLCRSWLAQRRTALFSYDPIELCKWFGVSCLVFEHRSDGSMPQDTVEQLPRNFKLERDAEYNGYEDEPWIIEVRCESYLVLEMLQPYDPPCEYILFAVPMRNIQVDKPENPDEN